jgi:hypothetical protein
VRAIRFAFLTAACLLFGIAIATETMLHSERLDPQVSRHYEAACTAYSEGEYHRALAEIDLALLASGLVYIEGEPDTHLYRATLEGLEVWQAALGDESPFVVTRNRSEADVVIRFVRSIASDDGGEVCGHVEWRRKAVYSRTGHTALVSADILVSTHERSGAPHQRDSLIHIVAHELGHVLGLDDTGDPVDIMGPLLYGSPSTQLSGPELAAIQQFRARCEELKVTVCEAQGSS